MILKISRSSIKMKIGEKTVTIGGEALLRGYGSPDFVVFSNTIEYWDPPFDKILITNEIRAEIIKKLFEEMEEKNMTIEIE